ncbi:MAG: UDP-3-O-[3-hydroxymyristoyl] N-acetylglucosamine deacetylase [Spirochaetes bacterium GWF1_51_8]|nr:MAG: UDP-3-O-[3-hydroxymyristoyl] N-acetylglucosamine deacetylase [Spirochaetes bacterium GWF1_51_8]
MRIQNTLKNKITFRGKGLHSGSMGNLTLQPAPEDTGIVFVLKDGRQKQFIPYIPDNIIDTRNNITVSNGKALVRTVEHLVAALYGMRVDNCLIETEMNEIPIMDGSALEFIEGIQETGVVEQDKEREELRIVNPVWVTSEDKFIVALPYNGLKLSYTISFPNSPIGTQTFNLDFSTESFLNKIAGARTFGFIEDLDYYRKNGLVLGGDFDNVHVFSRKENRSLNSPRYDDEPVRHKVLDLVGGIAMLNFDIKAFIISYKGGHTLDTLFAQRVMSTISGVQKVGNVYSYGSDTNYYYMLADILDLEKYPS